MYDRLFKLTGPLDRGLGFEASRRRAEPLSVCIMHAFVFQIIVWKNCAELLGGELKIYLKTIIGRACVLGGGGEKQ